MRTMRFGAAALVLPLLYLIYSPHVSAQERYWEVLTLFGGADTDTRDRWLIHDAKRDRFIFGGNTMERDLPVTPNAMKPRLTDQMDGFIAVFNGDCTELVYCSYIGGSLNDAITDAVLLDDDRLLIALSSYSHDLPTTGNAWYAQAPGSGNTWLAVLSLDNYSILDAGFFGGSTEDSVDRITVMKNGNILITGNAASTDLPVTPNSFQPRKRGNVNDWDAFIAIFDSTFQLTYCSYHGGATGAGEDAWKGLAETEHYIAFAGTVLSTDMPVTDDAYQKTFAGGYYDAYLCVVSKDSLKRVYSTYLGGSRVDDIMEILSVGDDKIVIIGSTDSPDFPVTINAWQPEFGDIPPRDHGDIFIGVFSLQDGTFEQLTFFGGGAYDFAKSAFYDPVSDVVLIAGTTFSQDLPFLSPDTCACFSRGVIIHYNPRTLLPGPSVSIADIGYNSLNDILRTKDGRLMYSGGTTRKSGYDPLPVKSTGVKSTLTGSGDIFIGILRDTPVAVESLAEAMPGSVELAVYPQPVRDKLRFTFDGTHEGAAALFDLLGRKVCEVRLSGNGNTVHGVMGLGGVSPGIYMLVVRTADAVRTGRVVVAR